MVDANRLASGVHAACENVSERSQSGQARPLEHDIVARIMDTSPVGITVFDRQGRITFANRLVQDLAGRAGIPRLAGCAYNDPLWRLLTEDGKPAPDEALPFAQVLSGGKAVLESRYAIELPDGQRLYLSSNATPILDSSGEIEGVVVTTEDITERVRAEARLRESEAKYRDLVEKVSDVIYTLDIDGRITYVSPAVESCLGYSPEQLVGRSFSEFVAPEDSGGNLRFRELLSGRELGPAEYQVVAASGKLHWVRLSNQPILDGDEMRGIRGVLTDITERVKAEQQREEAAAAAERERLARDLHDAVTQSLFSVAAIAEALPSVWKRDQAEAYHGLEELRRLTSGALAEMRGLLLELRPSALAEHRLDTLLHLLTEGMTSRTRIPVDIQLTGDCSLPTEVQVALYRIAQEALNNVVKHARASSATIGLLCQPGYASLSVTDDGRGFDPTATRLDGLGLDIMRERAQAVGAVLTIESQPGQGTRILAEWRQRQEGTKDE